MDRRARGLDKLPDVEFAVTDLADVVARPRLGPGRRDNDLARGVGLEDGPRFIMLRHRALLDDAALANRASTELAVVERLG